MRQRMALMAAALLVAAGLVRTQQGQQSPDPRCRPGRDRCDGMGVPHALGLHRRRPGTCPRCGMALVHAAPFDVRDYDLNFRTVPAVVRAGQQRHAAISGRTSRHGEVVKKFETVHERQYHLFVISQDMEHFEHIHPRELADGTWTIEVTLPKPGYYKVLSDMLPSGGSSQFIARPLVTAGYSGDLVAEQRAPRAGYDVDEDRRRHHRVGRLRPAAVRGWAAWPHHLSPHRCRDRPADHRLADLSRGVRPHAHHERGHGGHTCTRIRFDIIASPDDDGGPPVFMIPPGADLEKLRGGPDVTFEGLMPKAGRYRAWTQFRRNDTLHTFAFTFEVVAAQ